MGVVPAPAFTDPNRPEAAKGSVNQTLDKHPMDHAESYGAARQGVTIEEPEVEGVPETPEDEWTNDDYKKALKAVGLPVSGNRAELEERWNEHKENGEEE